MLHLKDVAVSLRLFGRKSCTVQHWRRSCLGRRLEIEPKVNSLLGASRLQSTSSTAFSTPTESEKASSNVGPMRMYSNMLNTGALKPDSDQFAVVKHLQHLYNEISKYDPALPKPETESNSDDKVKARTHPRGCYIFGEVGTGKTVLLDLIYDCLPEGCKKRVHFHNFMIYLYSEFNKWNLCCSNQADSAYLQSPTEYIADKVMEDAWIICFDEVQVADYASCSLLEGVLKNMLSKGALVIATSNRSIENLGDLSISESTDGEHPVDDESYESVRSFKGLLKSNCAALHLKSEHDYRLSLSPGRSTYAYPINNENEEWLDQAFSQAVGGGQSLTSRYVTVYGRKVLVPIASSNGVARFNSKELFDQPLGPADFIQICNNYSTIFIDRIPKMGMTQRNQARRFLSFIDAAYESRTKLYCTAESKPDDIFTLLPRDGNNSDNYDDQMHFEMIGEIAYDLALSQLDFRSLGIITGEDEIFSFKRAISRLKEMQSLLYQMRPHRKQTFNPYLGTKEEREWAVDKRRDRMIKRQQIIDEIEEKKHKGDDFAKLRETVDEVLANNPSGEMQERSIEHRYKDLDWGDEASYTTWSQTVAQKGKYDETVQKLSEKIRSKGPMPKFGEQHFWGFGWLEKAIKRMKNRKPEETDKENE